MENTPPVQDHAEPLAKPENLQQQRPRFLRAITSPIPALSAFVSPTLHSPPPASTFNRTAGDEPQDGLGKSARPRPRPQPLQLDAGQHAPSTLLDETTMRTFSSTLLSPFLPSSPGSIMSMPTSPLTSSHSQGSIAETLKERRWSKAQTLNWMPGFTTGYCADGSDFHPSPVTASASSSRSNKSAHKRRSEVPGKQCVVDTNPDNYDGCASLGLDYISVAGNNCNSQESGRTSTLSSDTTVGLAERLSAFTLSMRGKSSFSSGHLSPPCSSESSVSTPNANEARADLALGQTLTLPCQAMGRANDYKSWEEFLNDYRQGQFPGDKVVSRPRVDSAYPPLPAYAGSVYAPQYLAPPITTEEEQRLRALYSFRILETGTDASFQRIARLVATVLAVEGCMISLVDYDRISVKAHHQADILECSREESLSGHAILRPANDPLVVLDASQDWRFKNLPIVLGTPRVRFYAGAPLTTASGFNIGSLCVVDTKPRQAFSEKDKTLLVDFATIVMREMELWNDQVELCTRTRMMRDITFWVRGRLGMADNESAASSTTSSPPQSVGSKFGTVGPSTCNPDDTASAPCYEAIPATPPDAAPVLTGSMSNDPVILPFNTSLPDPALPTPNGSPTFQSSKLAAISETDEPMKQRLGPKDSLHDEAFPSACSMIRMTLNVDAVYLVQVESNQSFIPLSGSDVVWNYLGPGSARRAPVGTASGDNDGHIQTSPDLVLSCLASSQNMQEPSARSIFDQATKQAKREGNSWICTDEGCRPHRLGDVLSSAVEPEWGRDLPVIKEMVGYVRQEHQAPQGTSGPLYTCCKSESDWFNPSSDTTNATHKDTMRRSHLCHTFQDTLSALSAGATSPYKSCVVMPVHGAPASDMSPKDDSEPWAYFVVLSSSRTKQFTLHERIYLKNFGSCLITEVLKRRVEAADKAKGVFIKSISHELRTPLHIILGILELLNANLEGNLSDHQLSMIASAEASGKGLIDTINNIIDLADLDPDNDTENRRSDKGKGSLADLYTQVSEVDIRVLCEQVAGAMAKDCIDKNLVVLPSWAKPSLGSSSLSSNATSFSPNSMSSTSMSSTAQTWSYSANRSSMEESAQGTASSSDSSSGLSSSMFRSEQKVSLELLVAMDEPERDPDQEAAHWNFLLNVSVIKRILIQLLENALKFTTTGFVEISAVSPPLAMLPLKPPQPDARPILFTVRDTGRGISPEFVQAHLFQRFSQEDPLQAGTGLGLALVKLLVESLGGWLEIWSEGIEGKGCVVRVLIWATPCTNTSKSLKDEAGPWQEKSCRFYAGEPTVSTDRLWTIMGERMLGQDLNMNVQRGNEQDVSPEDMVKDLSDQSPCDLLVFNDDLARLKAYLSHWSDQQAAITSGAEDERTSFPIPLLMLTSILNEKRALDLVEAYRSAWEVSNKQGQLATVVIMPKPIGPIKLMNCIHQCFAPQDGTSDQDPAAELSPPSAVPVLQSETTSRINTVPLGMHNNSNKNFSAGTLIRSSFKFPASNSSGAVSGSDETTTGVISLDKAHSPQEPTPKEPCVPKSKPHRSIRNFVVPRSGGAPRISSKKRTVSVDVAGQSSLGCCTDANGKRVPESTDQLGELHPVPRVLIVEDNMTNRMILRTFLRKRGVTVVEAENGKLGVERFQEEVWRRQGRCGFDFVLMDLQMPVMDGNLATKRIREFEQTMVTQHGLSTPEPQNVDKMCGMVAPADEQQEPDSDRRGYTRTMIFALTGLAGEEDKRLAFECGVDGYLTKPVSLKNLGALLSSCHPSMVKGDRQRLP
ncbi:His Kinase A domain containing protein [Mortierella antarctica]|nr:His Kinase A domain containing protein [Mortierella antarctica]